MQVGQAKNAIQNEYLASLHVGLCCCQPYELQSVKHEHVAATNRGKCEAFTVTSVLRCSQKTMTKWWTSSMSLSLS